MANKPGGKMLLIITTCMSVIAAFSLFNNGPQHLLAGTKTRLYNEQNVVYDRQKAGGSQVAYKTYCTDSNCTFQYAGEGSDKKIAVINMDKDSTVMSELAEIVDADLIDGSLAAFVDTHFQVDGVAHDVYFHRFEAVEQITVVVVEVADGIVIGHCTFFK